jgi:hypothetical protein
LFLFPAIWCGLLLLPASKFQEKKFNRKYGAMFDQMRPGRKIYLLYYVLFSLRRLIFCALAFYCTHLSFFQVQMLMYLNLLVLLYVGGVKPFETRFKNRIEMFNELCICLLTIQMCLFTDFVGGKEAQFDAGWQMVGVMGFNMLSNFGIVLVIGALGTRLMIIKYGRLSGRFFKRLPGNTVICCKKSIICFRGQKEKIALLCQKLSSSPEAPKKPK